jgi:glycerol uptake facilitator-like aquaporin
MKYDSDARAALLAECLGTAGLLAVVVGSGIMAERLAGGNAAIALLANALATGAGLIALILALGGVSGAHFNPLVTVLVAWDGGLAWRRVPGYVAAQIAGGVAGTMVAHAMFSLPLLQVSVHERSGPAQWLSESVAVIGLLLTIRGCSRHASAATPFAVACYVVAGYWFTASTCFANPAVTIARACSDTFAGIRPLDAPGFILAQFAGLALAIVLIRILYPGKHP